MDKKLRKKEVQWLNLYFNLHFAKFEERIYGDIIFFKKVGCIFFFLMGKKDC